MPEFLMVSVLLIALLMAVVQVGLYLHVRNVIAASAAEGARYGADADVDDPRAGGALAGEIIGRSLGRRVSDATTCGGSYQPGEGGSTLVAVRCTGKVPLVFSWLGSLPGLDVTARSLREGVP